MRYPFFASAADIQRHGSVFVLFAGLLTATWRSYGDSIPARDVAASLLGLAATAAAVLRMQFTARPKPRTNRTAAFVRRFQQISLLETVFLLLIPHALLVWTGRAPASPKGYAIADVLVPHLFIFQVQIALESLLCLTDAHAHLLFPYTAAANAYRLVPVLATLRRSAHILRSDAAAPPFGGMDYVVLGLLPAVMAALWVLSSFYFLPFVWLPQIEYPK